MRRIHVLPPDLALKIAAGEVVERPASVVKELLDNAIDAGARRVRIDIRDGGLGQIRVTDDGCGIPREDVPLAFQSHATSKIGSMDDLLALDTLGFRGEALPSIAAVSRVEMQTRDPNEEAGTAYTLEWGEVVDERTSGAAPGTRVTVSNLFGNVPARRKFVRSLRSETGQIASVVMQYALARPDLHLSLHVDGQQTFMAPGTGRLEDAIAAVHGADVPEHLIPIGRESEGVQVTGLISAPSLNRPNRSAVTFAVNRRPIANRSLQYALEEAYSGFLMTGRHPVAAVHVTLAPGDVDANVHPTKAEVRFAADRAVHGAVHRAAAEALLEMRQGARTLGDREEIAFEPLPATPAPLPMDTPALLTDVPALRVFGQTSATYIVAEGPHGLYMIDQHAAHERIIFDRLDEQLATGGVAGQPLLEPVPVDLTPEQMLALEENRELLCQTGFTIEPFGASGCLVRSVPALARGGAPADLVLEVLGELATAPEPSAARARALASMACRAAVKAGQVLDVQEMREIVVALEKTARPNTCPHGRPTMIHLSHSLLEREFGRR